MLVMLQQSYDELSREAAPTVASAVRKKPFLTLGLATGPARCRPVPFRATPVSPGKWRHRTPTATPGL